MRPAHRALAAVTAGVVVYNTLANDGETISEGIDELLEQHPWWTRTVAAVLAAHVCNAVPARVDVVHLAFVAARRLLHR